jgi:hypothetical protein
MALESLQPEYTPRTMLTENSKPIYSLVLVKTASLGANC